MFEQAHTAGISFWVPAYSHCSSISCTPAGAPGRRVGRRRAESRLPSLEMTMASRPSSFGTARELLRVPLFVPALIAILLAILAEAMGFNPLGGVKRG